MVVGHDHVDPELAGAVDGRNGRNAVVDRNDEGGFGIARGHNVDHVRGEAVAVHHAVGDKVGGADAEHLKAPEPHRAGGRAVAVVVGDDGDVFALVACDGKPFSSFARAFEHGGRNHPLPLLLKV